MIAASSTAVPGASGAPGASGVPGSRSATGAPAAPGVPASAARAASGAPVARRSPLASTVRRLGAHQLRMLGWFWLIAVPCLVLATVVVDRVLGSVDVAVSLYARQAAIWFPFSQAIVLVVGTLRVAVASGRTRRTFARATLVVCALNGLAYALVLTGMALAERAVHGSLGWESVITDAQLATEASPAWVLLLDLAITFVTANLAGLLVGIVYLRVGSGWATLALPLTVGPIIVVQYVSGGWVGPLPIGWASSTAGQVTTTAAAAALVIALTAAAYAALVRTAPIRTTS